MRFCLFLLMMLLGISENLFASSSGLVAMANFYAMALESAGFTDAHQIHTYQPIVAAIVSLLILFVFGMIFSFSVNSFKDDGVPSDRLSVRSFFEMILDFLWDTLEGSLGSVAMKQFLPLLCGIFLFILVSNATGLIPGFPPATESLDTNLAMGITVFVVYNFYGVKVNGLAYLTHFLGPVWWLAPLFLTIELVSHAVRPFTLSFRLYGNIFGDHLVLNVLTSLVPLGVPVISLLFGTLVVILQSFVFTLLSTIYISMAISHNDEH